MLLWSQLKNCLELVKKVRREEATVKVVELINKNKILQQRADDLMLIKSGSKLEPVRKEQLELKFQEVRGLCQEINKLGLTLDPNKCEIAIPTMIVNKEATIMLTVRNINNNLISDISEEMNVSVQAAKSGEAIAVKIKELGSGRYKTTFTPTRCGYHMVTVQVDGHHISGSPCK